MDTKKKFKILIADDEPGILELMADTFNSHRYDLYLASNGMEAIDILKLKVIDLVISDFRMPNGNGMAILNFVNLMEKKPIFLFFSSDFELESNDCLKLGVKQVFPKPFSLCQLISEVEKESIIFFKRA
ncbi:MAG: response regulator [Bacteriovorax sp.]|nr:response regulator [Bacteriovorax sp.]